MSTKAGRAPWSLAIGAFGILLGAIVVNLCGDHAATSVGVRKLAAAGPAASTPPAMHAASALVHGRLRYIVQSTNADMARRAVQDAGGVVTSDLSVIRAVGASLDERELAALRTLRNPGLKIYEDTAVRSSSV